ncbi:MAG: alpha/beta fold hydrolase [Acidobacteriota bacterium]|nr:alpha/beta fold hydrolase [Acidobacteriota bacterium]
MLALRLKQFLIVLPVVFLASMPARAAQTDYAALGRTFVLEFASGQYAKVEAQFSQQVASKAPVAVLPEIWKSVEAKYGGFEKISAVTTLTYKQYNVVTVSCQFEKSPLNIRVSFDSDNKVAGFFFLPASPSQSWSAPSYANPAAFHEQSVTVGHAPWALPGTLTLPDGRGPFPAVELVQGSGALDEDETIGPNKPFKDLAWGLASDGIAVLRYEKRTAKYGAEIAAHPAGFTVKQETIDDARSAVSLLSAQPKINRNQIYVLGHSLGGMLAPRIAKGDAQIAGIILLAGNTEQLAQAVVRQIKDEAALQSKPTPETERVISGAEEEARQIDSPSLKAGDSVTFLGDKLPASYFLDLRSYNPAATAAALKIPILVLQGGRDFNVTVPDDFDVWKKALASHPRVTFKFYPTLDHLFMTGSQPPSPRDDLRPGHVSGEVIADIAQWVKSLN